MKLKVRSEHVISADGGFSEVVMVRCEVCGLEEMTIDGYMSEDERIYDYILRVWPPCVFSFKREM